MYFANNSEEYLQADILATDSSLTVPLVNSFPSNYPFLVTLTVDETSYEIIKVFSLNSTTATTKVYNISRAQENTLAQGWSAGTTKASNRITAEVASSWLEAPAQSYAGVTLGRLASGSSHAVCIGAGATATNNYSVVIGDSAYDTGGYSVTLGYRSEGSEYGVSLGSQTTTSARKAVAIGESAKSSSYSGLAIGVRASTGSGSKAIVLGANASAYASTGASNIVIGVSAKVSHATGANGIALGSLAEGRHTDSIAVGRSSKAWFSSISIGTASSSSGTRCTAIGDSSFAAWSYDVTVGFAARTKTGFGGSTAIGKRPKAYGSNSIAIGTGAYAYNSDGIAIGRASKARRRGEALGLWAYAGIAAGEEGNVAVGTNAYAQGGKYSTSVGYRARGYTTYTTSIGAYAYNYANGASIMGIYSYASSAATQGLALGYKSKVYGTNGISLGSYGVNNLAASTMIQNPITIRKDTGSTQPSRDFAGVENVMMTNELDVTTLGSATITLPTGGLFLPREAGVMCSSFGGTIVNLTQGTVVAEISTDGITYLPLHPNTLTTALTGLRTFESLVSSGLTSGATHLRLRVTALGSATDGALVPQLYKVRAFFKGIFLEE